MQSINSTVIRELSTIFFFWQLLSGGLYLGGGGLYPGAYKWEVYPGGLYTQGLISRGIYPGSLYLGGL